MLIYSTVHVSQTLILTMLIAIGVVAVGGGAQDGMFSGGEAYERFMGRWSREIAPLLVKCAGVRDGDTILDVGSGTGPIVQSCSMLARGPCAGSCPDVWSCAQIRLRW